MNQLIVFIRKEFQHILRDRRTLLLLFGMPIMQILIFGFALSNEVKNAKLIILDNAKDERSQVLANRLSASKYFDLVENIHEYPEIDKIFKSGKAKIAVVIPSDFGRTLAHTNSAQVQIVTDASEPNTATTLINYASSIIMDYQTALMGEAEVPYRIVPEIRMLYNPQLKAAYNFVPGVMAMVLFLVSAMMTSIAIVREKELGTMEILLVSPMKPILVILSKMIPYLLFSIINVIIILLLSRYVLDVPIRGNLTLLMGESILFIIACLSLGLLISNVANSQQTAMFISLVGFMMPTIIFSGFMFPIENMPLPLQYISNIVPSKWFFFIIKSVMVKGLGFSNIIKETLVLVGMTLFFLAVSFKNFKRRLE